MSFSIGPVGKVCKTFKQDFNFFLYIEMQISCTKLVDDAHVALRSTQVLLHTCVGLHSILLADFKLSQIFVINLASSPVEERKAAASIFHHSHFALVDTQISSINLRKLRR